MSLNFAFLDGNALEYEGRKDKAYCKYHPGELYNTILPEESLKIFGKIIAVSCPHCEKEIQRHLETQKKIQEEIEYKERIFNSNIPKIHLEKILKAPIKAYCSEQENRLEVFRQYIASPIAHTGVIITGKQGTGKSLLLCSGLVNLAKWGTIYYTTAYEIYQEWREDLGKEIKIKNFLLSRDYLVIDEIDLYPRASDFDNRFWLLLNQIFSQRYDNGKSTWIASNLPIGELEKVLGERIIRRLLENGLYLNFEFESLRNLKIKSNGK